MAPRIVFASLRIRNDWTICTPPSTTSQTPATKTSTTIESIGQTRTTRPAITETRPRTMYQPRPGRFDSLIAAAEAATPWKIKAIPIHSDSRRIAYPSPKWRNDRIESTTDSAPLMNSRTRIPADTDTVKDMNSPMNPVDSRYTPNSVEVTRIVGPGQTRTMAPRTIVSRPAARVHFH